jgi:hypothetical protein
MGRSDRDSVSVRIQFSESRRGESSWPCVLSGNAGPEPTNRPHNSALIEGSGLLRTASLRTKNLRQRPNDAMVSRVWRCVAGDAVRCETAYALARARALHWRSAPCGRPAPWRPLAGALPPRKLDHGVQGARSPSAVCGRLGSRHMACLTSGCATPLPTSAHMVCPTDRSGLQWQF